MAGQKPGNGTKDYCWMNWSRGHVGAPTFGWLRREVQERGVPDVDPTVSDLLAVEAENALRELTGLIELHAQKPCSAAAR
jgi:hypothetical protein